jgi:hypothetical protein
VLGLFDGLVVVRQVHRHDAPDEQRRGQDHAGCEQEGRALAGDEAVLGRALEGGPGLAADAVGDLDRSSH